MCNQPWGAPVKELRGVNYRITQKAWHTRFTTSLYYYMLLVILIWRTHSRAQARPIKMYVISAIVQSLFYVVKKPFQYMMCVCLKSLEAFKYRFTVSGYAKIVYVNYKNIPVYRIEPLRCMSTYSSSYFLWRPKSEVLPGLEPGTFSVLTRCHDQLDHSTKLFLMFKVLCISYKYIPKSGKRRAELVLKMEMMLHLLLWIKVWLGWRVGT